MYNGCLNEEIRIKNNKKYFGRKTYSAALQVFKTLNYEFNLRIYRCVQFHSFVLVNDFVKNSRKNWVQGEGGEVKCVAINLFSRFAVRKRFQ